MSSPQTIRERCVTLLGMACLIATLLLIPLGVRVVRASDDDSPPLSSTDPALVESQRATERDADDLSPAPARPVLTAEDAEQIRRPGVSAVEVAPGTIVLNTRGFNYGPPPAELDPAALQAEKPQK